MIDIGFGVKFVENSLQKKNMLIDRPARHSRQLHVNEMIFDWKIAWIFISNAQMTDSALREYAFRINDILDEISKCLSA